MHQRDEWQTTQLGNGLVQHRKNELRLSIPSGSSHHYHDAQVSDYSARFLDFHNRPPLRLTVKARAEGTVRGTAGFGFWNHSFVPGERGFRIPQALWFFFASPPSDISLAQGLAGHGWKAAVFDARRWRFYALLPLAPLGFLLMRSKTLYRALWPVGQHAIGLCETALDSSLLDDFHSYAIDWLPNATLFSVDGQTVLKTNHAPGEALGFIAWIDNQYAVVTPQGNFGRGLLDVPKPQSLILRDLDISHQE